MGTRLQLHELFKDLTGSENVYFQPPTNIGMQYPCVVYNRDYESSSYADNLPYIRTWRYQVTVIDRDPDSPLLDKVAGLPMTTFVRHFIADNLNHDVYDVYF
jgi:hypothetical protein